jgi:hypothetical protein
MPLQADPLTLTLLAIVVVLAIGIIARLLTVRLAARRQQKETAAVRTTIVDYFRRSGVAVSVDCVRLCDGALIAMIESEPMKRFRLSHIIEMTVREQVRKGCGVELDKIYWRFPIKEGAEADSRKPKQDSDEYINEGLEHYRHLPKTEVEELPWESFEQVTGDTAGKS